LKKATDLVYHENRYKEQYSPYVIYLPSNDVMFKMMRACLGCDKADDLWFLHGNKKKEEPEPQPAVEEGEQQ